MVSEHEEIAFLDCTLSYFAASGSSRLRQGRKEIGINLLGLDM